jgi:hypothetical protein
MQESGANNITNNFKNFIESGNTVQGRTNPDIPKVLNLYLSKFFFSTSSIFKEAGSSICHYT